MKIEKEVKILKGRKKLPIPKSGYLNLGILIGVWALAANPFAATQFVRTPEFKPFAAKPLTAEPLAALLLTAGHL